MNTNKRIITIFIIILVSALVFIGTCFLIYINGKGGVEIKTTIAGNVPFYAQATFNGQKIMTPTTINRLKPGKYLLIIDRTDVSNTKHEVEIKRFQTVIYNIELKPINGGGIVDETESQ